MPEIFPPHPTSTSFVHIRVTGSGCSPGLTFERQDFAIELRETVDCGCLVLAPPYALAVELGQLPAGEYLVHHTVSSMPIVETACTGELLGEANYSFSVAQAIVPPPVFVPISGTAALGLALAVAICAAIILRRRSDAQA